MNRIKQLRLEKGISQSDVASVVGITQQAVNHYEHGIRKTRLETCKKLADFFEGSVPYLQGFSEMSEQVYLIQSTDCLVDRAIQNAIVIAESKSDALAKFKKELKENSECTQEYKPEWFTCQKLDLSSSKTWLQYGGDTWRFNEVEYLDLEEGK